MVRLVPIDPAQFDSYIEPILREYAAENVKAGRWTEQEAAAESRKEVEGLLPQGAATPNHHLLWIVSEAGENVGALWVAIEPRGAFIYDIEVFARYRRQGYAEQAMRLVEAFARERGARKLLLHVFGDNRKARNLYQKLGY